MFRRLAIAAVSAAALTAAATSRVGVVFADHIFFVARPLNSLAVRFGATEFGHIVVTVVSTIAVWTFVFLLAGLAVSKIKRVRNVD